MNPPNVNVGSNNKIENNQFVLRPNSQQHDDLCYFIDKNKKCMNNFQEKCNNCQFMFCKKHLFVQERAFFCDNCISISKVRTEVNSEYMGCLKCRDSFILCCCIGHYIYCCTIKNLMKKWSNNSHNRHKTTCKSQADCYGYSVLCGCVNIPCPGHGISLTSQEEEDIIEKNKKRYRK